MWDFLFPFDFSFLFFLNPLATTKVQTVLTNMKILNLKISATLLYFLTLHSFYNESLEISVLISHISRVRRKCSDTTMYTHY